MSIIEQLKTKVLRGAPLTIDEASRLMSIDDQQVYFLLGAAREITRYFNGNNIELCAIVPGKVGQCSEDCSFCAQSVHFRTQVNENNLLDGEKIVATAQRMEQQGAHRFAIVNSGYSPNAKEFAEVLHIYRLLRQKTNLKLCASLGVINGEMAKELKQVGISRYHHNVETSSSFYPQICTTHSYQERVETILAAKAVGLEVCCGGIISVGESAQQRLEMAFEIRDLTVESVPINILNPIAGTPLAEQKILPPLEILKTIALYRFILPDKKLRFAGGRVPALRDLQALGFVAGINATIIGDYLTTYGRSTVQDLQMLTDLGLHYN